MYDQGTLSLMTRGLPATRHIARTLDTWQTARHVVDTWHVDVDDTWQDVARSVDVAREGSLGRVCREAHEARVEGEKKSPQSGARRQSRYWPRTTAGVSSRTAA